MNIVIENLGYEYNSPFAPRRRALTDISLTVESGAMLAIAGAAGSGKTTLIQHFNGLLQPGEGRILVDGRDLGSPGTDLSCIRRQVGLLFQFPELQLFEETVYRDIAFGPKNIGCDAQQTDIRVRRSLELVGLDHETFSEKSPFQLSSGEKRRVAIAGVLAMEPRVLVLDEPTVGLDRRAAGLIEEILLDLHRKGATIVFISHDMDMVARLADKIAVLSDGRLIYHGERQQLFADADLLQNAGLDIPAVNRFLTELRVQGYQIHTDIYTLEAAKKEIDRWKAVQKNRLS